MRVSPAIVAVFILVAASQSAAQESTPTDHPHGDSSSTSSPVSWSWMTDENVLFGYNYQQRKFTDFSAWESQNWFMINGRDRFAAVSF